MKRVCCNNSKGSFYNNFANIEDLALSKTVRNSKVIHCVVVLSVVVISNGNVVVSSNVVVETVVVVVVGGATSGSARGTILNLTLKLYFAKV